MNSKQRVLAEKKNKRARLLSARDEVDGGESLDGKFLRDIINRGVELRHYEIGLRLLHLRRQFFVFRLEGLKRAVGSEYVYVYSEQSGAQCRQSASGKHRGAQSVGSSVQWL